MEIGKYLVVIGLLVAFAGVLFILSPKIPFLHSFGKMVGDFSYETKNVKIFLPITSMIVLSIVVTIVINIVYRIFTTSFVYYVT